MKQRWIWMRRGLLVLALATFNTAAFNTSALADSAADLHREAYRLEAQGKHAAALTTVEKIRATQGASYFITMRIGWLAYLAGRHPQSVTNYRRAASMAKGAIEPRLGLTLPLLAQQKWRELEKASRDVLVLDKLNATARARLAHAHYMVGNYPDSATVYRGLLAHYPSNLDHQTGLGWALVRMGRIAAGKRLFSAVLKVSPDNLSARQGMAVK